MAKPTIDLSELAVRIEEMIEAVNSGVYGNIAAKRDPLFETLAPNPGRMPIQIEELDISEDAKFALEELLAFTRRDTGRFQIEKRKGLKLLKDALEHCVKKKPKKSRNHERDSMAVKMQRNGKSLLLIMNAINKIDRFAPFNSESHVHMQCSRFKQKHGLN